MPPAADLHPESRKTTRGDSRMDGPAGATHTGGSGTYPEEQVNVITHAINISSRVRICNRKACTTSLFARPIDNNSIAESAHAGAKILRNATTSG